MDPRLGNVPSGRLFNSLHPSPIPSYPLSHPLVTCPIDSVLSRMGPGPGEYDRTRAVGSQPISQQRTAPSYGWGTGQRGRGGAGPQEGNGAGAK